MAKQHSGLYIIVYTLGFTITLHGMELETQYNPIPLESIENYIQETTTKVQWPHTQNKVSFNTSHDAWESLPNFNQYIQTIPMKELVEGAQYLTQTRKKIIGKPHDSLKFVEIGNFLDTMFSTMQREYTKRLDYTFLQKQYKQDNTCLDRIKCLYKITPTFPICSFLVHKELDTNQNSVTINRALGYIEHIYSVKNLCDTDQHELCLLNKHLFNMATKKGSPQTIIKAGLVHQSNSLVSYIKSLPKNNRLPLYKELAKGKWRKILNNNAYAIDPNDKQFLLCHMDLLQEKYARVTALFKKNNKTKNQTPIEYDHEGFCQLLQETIAMNLPTIAGELLLSWRTNFNTSEDVASLIHTLEHKNIISLIEQKIEQNPESTLLYPAVIGILYTDICPNYQIGQEKSNISLIAHKAKSFLSKIELDHIDLFHATLWQRLIQAQHKTLAYLSKHAAATDSFTDMFTYNAQLIKWGFREYKPMFKDLDNPVTISKIIENNSVEVIESIKIFLNTVEINLGTMPELLIPMAKCYDKGFTIFLYDKNGESVMITIIKKNEEHAQSLYETAARLGIPKARMILADREIAKGNIDEALKHYAHLGNNISAKLKIAELLTKKIVESTGNAQEAKKYLQEVKNICSKLATIQNPTQLKLLSRIHALSTHYDIDEQDPECPYLIAQKLQHMFQNITRNSIGYLDCVNPNVYTILKKKAQAIIKQNVITEQDSMLLSLFVYYNIVKNRFKYLVNPTPDKQIALIENMKFASYAAKNGNYLGKYCVALCLQENSFSKKVQLPPTYFTNLYEVITESTDIWIRDSGVHDLLTLAYQGNLAAQGLCLLDETLNLREFFNSCTIAFNPEKSLTPETAPLLIDILSEERLHYLNKFLSENPNNIPIQVFMFNIYYNLGLSILEKPSISSEETHIGIMNLMDAYRIGKSLQNIMQKKEDKENITKILATIKAACEKHVKIT